MNKKILLVSSTNLFSNPRMVKEIDLLNSLNYDLTVISFLIGPGDDKSKEIAKNYKSVKFIYLSALKTPLYTWVKYSFLNRLYYFLWLFFKLNLKFCAYSSNKRTIQILDFLKNNDEIFDLIICHTLAPLYSVYKYFKIKKVPFSFDMEDYHPGELIKKDSINETQRRKTILNKVLPHCFYVSFASPLFKKKLNINLDNTFTLLNGFPEKEFKLTKIKSNKVQMIWYSLTIDRGRGLELILPVLEEFEDKIHLTLVGNLNSEFDKKYKIKKSNFITYLGFKTQSELHELLCNSDIGLALEQSKTDLNRDLCLTNKIISYCQSGLYIFASNTSAQTELLKHNSNLGLISTNYRNDIISIINNINSIREEKTIRYEIGKLFNWETQKSKLLEQIKNV